MHGCCILCIVAYVATAATQSLKAASEEAVNLGEGQQHPLETGQAQQAHWTLTQSCAGAVSRNQVAVRSAAPQGASPPVRLLPGQHSPAPQHTISNHCTSRHMAAISSGARMACSLTDSCHRLADAGAPACTAGKGGTSSGMAPSSSGNCCRGTGEGEKAGSGLAASISKGSNSMRGGLGGRQERMESMGGCEALPVDSLTSAGQVRTAT